MIWRRIPTPAACCSFPGDGLPRGSVGETASSSMDGESQPKMTTFPILRDGDGGGGSSQWDDALEIKANPITFQILFLLLRLCLETKKLLRKMKKYTNKND